MSEPVIVLQPKSSVPVFTQIVEQIRAAICRDELNPGDQLPTVRQLSGDLAVAPNTVMRAYETLRDEGWLVGNGRNGTRVADELPLRRNGERARILSQELTRVVSSLIAQGFTAEEIKDAVERMLAPG